MIVQNNPLITLDRPSGLYGSRQMVIADRTAYGIPQNLFLSYAKNIGSIFDKGNISWQEIDPICQKYQIDILIINDTDTIWENINSLQVERNPIYQNKHYYLFPCDDNR